MPSPVGTCGGWACGRVTIQGGSGPLCAEPEPPRDACLPRTEGRFMPPPAFAAAAAPGLRKDLKETIKLTPSLWMEARAVGASVTFSFF